MTTQTEALKLALEALDQLTNAADTFSVSGVYFNEEVWAKKCLSDAYFAITAIKEALAQPEQEPVAWLKTWNSAGHAQTGMQRVDLTPECETWLANMFPTITPLYTTPPQRKPWVSLSDEDIERIAKKARSKDHAITLAMRELKEKNT